MLNNNKQLALILAGLVLAFLLVRWIKADKNVRSFKTTLFVVDTAQVNTIKLYPQAADQEEIRFVKDAGGWVVEKNGIRAAESPGAAQGLLRSILNIKPQRLAGRTEDQWSRYHVDDSLGTRVILENASGEELVDLIIGKFSYRQTAPQQNFAGRNNIQGWSYVRNYDEPETYATDGFLTMTFNRDFNSFRNKLILKTTPANIRNLQFQSAREENFSLTNTGNDWRMGEVIADSAKVADYLKQLRMINGSEIDDVFQPSGRADYQLTISGNNMTDLVISAYRIDSTFRIQSVLNPSTVFLSDSTGVFSRIFKQPADFLED